MKKVSILLLGLLMSSFVLSVETTSATPEAPDATEVSANLKCYTIKEKKSFIQANIGLEYLGFVSDRGVPTTGEYQLKFLGLNGGELYQYTESTGGKWSIGFDYGRGSYNDSETLNILIGFDGVIFMGTPAAAFILGPMLVASHTESTMGINSVSVGANIGFSFFPSEEVSIDLGTKYFDGGYYYKYNNKSTQGEGRTYTSQVYLGISAYF